MLSRRDLLTAALTAGAAASLQNAFAQTTRRKVIDAQVHGLRRLDDAGFAALAAVAGLRRLQLDPQVVPAGAVARLAKLSADDREQLRAQPPVEVLEALVALPSQRSRRFQLSYIR